MNNHNNITVFEQINAVLVSIRDISDQTPNIVTVVFIYYIFYINYIKPLYHTKIIGDVLLETWTLIAAKKQFQTRTKDEIFSCGYQWKPEIT